MLREFVIGWLCIMGMVVYTLLLGVRELGRKAIAAGQAVWNRFRAIGSQSS